YGRDFISKKYHIKDRSKISVIYNFVKKDLRYQDNSKLNRNPLTIVYPGGTSVQKSVDVIQHLVYKLLRSNLDFRFVWLGGTKLPGAKMSLFGLRTTESLFPSDPRLIITGNVSRDKAMEVIGNTNIFLLPSRGEGCPMTLLEAMRGGCIPVVSDAHHGSREILELSGTGIITKQGSASSLYNAIATIINNHELYISNYPKTKEYLNTELSEKKWAEKMTKVIMDAINTTKLTIPLSFKAFKKSYHCYSRLMYWERIKTIFRSAHYRIKLDLMYILYKLGLINH
ncbi:MAG: glycosyltransferase family 4 protein, partial [Allobaculum sp.]|nr:glycosyltransferase family 4 protein [Allobaculum sp.]